MKRDRILPILQEVEIVEYPPPMIRGHAAIAAAHRTGYLLVFDMRHGWERLRFNANLKEIVTDVHDRDLWRYGHSHHC